MLRMGIGKGQWRLIGGGTLTDVNRTMYEYGLLTDGYFEVFFNPQVRLCIPFDGDTDFSSAAV